MMMTSDETQIQIFANWPMSHAKCMTKDKRKNPQYHVVVTIRKLWTEKNCPAEKSWPNHDKNEQHKRSMALENTGQFRQWYYCHWQFVSTWEVSIVFFGFSSFTSAKNISVILIVMQLPAFCNFCTNFVDIKVYLKLCHDDICNKLCNNVLYYNVSAQVLILKFLNLAMCVVWFNALLKRGRLGSPL